ncbi:MAG: lysophospholipid acyltransferase family protein [bacterium]|nr:lysophospholipid acyltransferase family protein [bacterium]
MSSDDAIPESVSADTKKPLPAAIKFRAIDYLLGVVFYLAFISTLIVFEFVLRLAWLIGGAKNYHLAELALNRAIKTCLRLVGTKFVVRGEIPAISGPAIIVSNHQSMYDIPIIYTLFARLSPKFVAKQELGRGVPSVSVNLRYSQALLIDRSDPRKALPALIKYGRRAAEEGWTVAIFPEGTRSRTGIPGQFRPAGLAALMKSMPGAPVIPLAIDGAWCLAARKFGPVPTGTVVTVTVGEPIATTAEDVSADEVLARCEQHVRQCVKTPVK